MHRHPHQSDKGPASQNPTCTSASSFRRRSSASAALRACSAARADTAACSAARRCSSACSAIRICGGRAPAAMCAVGLEQDPALACSCRTCVATLSQDLSLDASSWPAHDHTSSHSRNSISGSLTTQSVTSRSTLQGMPQPEPRGLCRLLDAHRVVPLRLECRLPLRLRGLSGPPRMLSRRGSDLRKWTSLRWSIAHVFRICRTLHTRTIDFNTGQHADCENHTTCARDHVPLLASSTRSV